MSIAGTPCTDTRTVRNTRDTTVITCPQPLSGNVEIIFSDGAIPCTLKFLVLGLCSLYFSETLKKVIMRVFQFYQSQFQFRIDCKKYLCLLNFTYFLFTPNELSTNHNIISILREPSNRQDSLCDKSCN